MSERVHCEEEEEKEEEAGGAGGGGVKQGSSCGDGGDSGSSGEHGGVDGGLPKGKQCVYRLSLVCRRLDPNPC